MSAFESCSASLQMPDAAACRIIRAPLRTEGFKLTAASDISLSAFNHAAAHLLRWKYVNPTSTYCNGIRNLPLANFSTLLLQNFWRLSSNYSLTDERGLLTQ